MSVATALTSALGDSLVLASFTQQPDIQHLVSQGQIISTDPPLLMDGQTHKYNFNSMIQKATL